jgi:hypothetical protein
LGDDFLGDEFAASDDEEGGPGAEMFGDDDEEEEEEEEEEDIFASNSEESDDDDDMEAKSRKLDAAKKAEAEEAEAELQTNIMLENDKYVLPGDDHEALHSTDLQVVLARIQEIVRVLNNFREMREGNRYSSYADVCELCITPGGSKKLTHISVELLNGTDRVTTTSPSCSRISACTTDTTST